MTESTSLDIRTGGTLVQPATGEQIALDAPDEELAKALYEVRYLEQQLRSFKSHVGDELLKRMDSSASWTRHAGPYELRGTSPEPKREYDAEELAILLDGLVQKGEISPEARDAAVEIEVRYKAKLRGIDKLKKVPGIGEKVETCERLVEAERRAPSVSKKA